MAKNDKPKKLLVEGQDDLRVIPELIEKNGIFWGNKKEEAIISIQECGGYENITSDLIEPGRQIHQAIKYNILNPNNPKVQGFINWFKELYDL
ncbi:MULTISPECIES: DUF3226 domain-containing protein [unclassified Sphaerospermopsis]|uniref:DUF3226 domain-containing protein n=1 Tax=unclassified Sphaerospermopsis TaxID=2646443 RepID=UPI00168005E4|nr:MULTISPECIES: DUF3226 domain-containing protein [unclassified Sphaerospermopsis]MBD2132483.1 hypothetical protein [Sphaerospermopsis sp. FACHB-1094]MBD2146558.1 hypothetical protein [Sphaerospermopsis sp. FACHB-1194]